MEKLLVCENIDSPRRERTTDIEVRWVRSEKGGFIRDDSRYVLVKVSPLLQKKDKHKKEMTIMILECDFHFKLMREPKTKKVTLVVEDEG